MFEFTHGGLWFKWDALDPASKRLAGWSMAAAAVGGGALGIMFAGYSDNPFYRLGYWAASGRSAASGVHHLLPPAWTSGVGFLMLLLSAVLWWRFSLRQDEMFNRVQNWALGMSGAVTSAVLAGWALLSLGGLLPPVTPLPLILGFWSAMAIFWLVAVRRWA